MSPPLLPTGFCQSVRFIRSASPGQPRKKCPWSCCAPGGALCIWDSLLQFTELLLLPLVHLTAEQAFGHLIHLRFCFSGSVFSERIAAVGGTELESGQGHHLPPNLESPLESVSVFVTLPHQYQLEEGYLGSRAGLGKGREIPVFRMNSGEDRVKNGSTLALNLSPQIRIIVD